MEKTLLVKHFTSPDESRPFAAHGRVDLLQFEGGAVGRAIFEPGWKWSQDVKPIAGTPSCQADHAGYVLSGRMRIRMDDGNEAEMGPGDFFAIPPGHDAWVVGNEACVVFDFAGVTHYAERAAGAAASAPSPSSAP